MDDGYTTVRMDRMNQLHPIRGEVWRVNFDPSVGDEICKIRPVVVMSVGDVGLLQLRVIVPITGWNPKYERYTRMVQLYPAESNGMTKISSADTFQIASMSLLRFQEKIGSLETSEVEEIAESITLTIGYSLPQPA